MKLVIHNNTLNPHLAHLDYLLQAPSILALMVGGYAILNLNITPLNQIKAQSTIIINGDADESDLLDEVEIDVQPEKNERIQIETEDQNHPMPHVKIILDSLFNLSIQYINPVELGGAERPIRYQGFFCLLRGKLLEILNTIFIEQNKRYYLKKVITNGRNNPFRKVPLVLLENIFAYSCDGLPEIKPEQCLVWARAIKSQPPISLEDIEQREERETRRNCRSNCCSIS